VDPFGAGGDTMAAPLARSDDLKYVVLIYSNPATWSA